MCLAEHDRVYGLVVTATLRSEPRTVLASLVVAHLANDFYSSVMPAFLPAVAIEFSLDYTELGILTFAFIVLTGLLQPIIGSTADRLGRRRLTLVTGFVVGATGFVAMASAPTFAFIVVVSLLCGLGGATYHPQAAAFIVDAYPDRRGRMLGIHGWGGSGGHFLAPAVVVLSLSIMSWRIAMGLVAVPLLAAAALLRVKLHETEPTPGASLRSAVSRPLVQIALAFAVISASATSFLTFFVKMLVDEGWDQTDAGLLLALMLLGGAVAQPLGGWGHDRLGGRQVITISASLMAVFIIVFAASSGAVSLMAIAGIVFVDFTLFPVSLAYASEFVPKNQTGAGAGVVFGLSALVVASAQPAVGALAESLGDIRAALVWTLPVVLFGLVMARIAPTPAVTT